MKRGFPINYVRNGDADLLSACAQIFGKRRDDASDVVTIVKGCAPSMQHMAIGQETWRVIVPKLPHQRMSYVL